MLKAIGLLKSVAGTQPGNAGGYARVAAGLVAAHWSVTANGELE